ncbi:hypothetical protein Cgig2_019388 [Carnegiea gigantea]|uniref:Uncharacterized protein n=1 Tax=Carnegiea gigantea TaxID=171969 RepID=A0A9Q1QFZ3_9CARY|nr:hypothetical protein Cgig2_019388 [Carnegiea gigantea]
MKQSARFNISLILGANSSTKEKFVLRVNEVIDKKLLRYVGKAWRNHRYQLKRDHKKLGKTKQDVKDTRPGNLARDQWIKLVNYWFSKRCEKLSNQGKEARASQEHYHTTGNESFVMKRDEFQTAETLIAERTTDNSSAKDVEDELGALSLVMDFGYLLHNVYTGSM